MYTPKPLTTMQTSTAPNEINYHHHRRRPLSTTIQPSKQSQANFTIEQMIESKIRTLSHFKTLFHYERERHEQSLDQMQQKIQFYPMKYK